MNSRETVIAAAHRMQSNGTPYALVSVVRAQAPTSARPGDRAVVTADGQLLGWVGGGCVQPIVLRTVRRVLEDGRARLIRIAPSDQDRQEDCGDVLEFGMHCHSGGTLELFIDPVLPPPRIVVIGASPVVHSLVELAVHTGFAVTVVAHETDPADFAHAQRVMTSDEPARVTPEIAPGAWVVVATQGRRDMPALKLALSLQARQIAFVASARKAGALKALLVADGADRDSVAAIVAPAGLAVMPTETHQEIALSVLAAIVSQRRQTCAPVIESVPALAAQAAPSSVHSCCAENNELLT